MNNRKIVAACSAALLLCGCETGSEPDGSYKKGMVKAAVLVAAASVVPHRVPDGLWFMEWTDSSQVNCFIVSAEYQNSPQPPKVIDFLAREFEGSDGQTHWIAEPVQDGPKRITTVMGEFEEYARSQPPYHGPGD